jgi:pimeloyl-ACP methyl ester carboxylesterase
LNKYRYSSKEVNLLFKRKTPVPTKLPDSLYSLETINLGGLDQSILIRTDDTKHPLLLFLHGGPGTAQIGFARRFQRELEKEFIVVNWDQRGAGLSQPDVYRKEDFSIQTYLDDAKELISTLLKRFKKEKLYLVGHSWGTILGTTLAKEFSVYLYAYVGVGQIVNAVEGERLSYDFVLKKAEERGDKKALNRLKNLTFDPGSLEYLFTQRKLLDRYKGSIYSMSGSQLFFGEFLKNTEYLLNDWLRYFKGNKRSLEMMWQEVAKTDFTNVVEFSIPIYFCAGRKDYNTPSELTEKYFQMIQAPKKELIWFEHSGHCPPFEEHEKFNQFLSGIKHFEMDRIVK